MAFGGGMFLFEPFKLAVLESLLPNGSSQLGPPLCFNITMKFQIKHICLKLPISIYMFIVSCIIVLLIMHSNFYDMQSI